MLEILRSDLFLVFFVPPFHFFVFFFTPTGNGLRWKAVKQLRLAAAHADIPFHRDRQMEGWVEQQCWAVLSVEGWAVLEHYLEHNPISSIGR